MSNIDKHALNQEKIEWLNKLADMEYCKSNPGHWLMSLKDTNMLAQLALHSQALLDELEDKDKRIAELESERDKQGRRACELFDEVAFQRQQIAELVAAGIITKVGGVGI
ncbi:hypothetical protein [Enterobacter cloacae]|uniref:hypothetical protein n=1 Tax=Enterobacter cloacae TaxID=550 RepID=UPI001FD7E58D|nr:hypothetical protein [Enterobacter cloacae]